MNKITMKIGAGIATAALFAMTAMPTFASSINISGNGNGSSNNVGITKGTFKSITQVNESSVLIGVDSSSNTGRNSASFNTGGGNGIAAGTATTITNLGVEGSSNTATTPTCGCGKNNSSISILGNGNGSHNNVWINKYNSSNVSQTNFADTGILVGNSSNSGGNNSNFNTGGLNGIITNPSNSIVGVSVYAPSNTLNP